MNALIVGELDRIKTFIYVPNVHGGSIVKVIFDELKFTYPLFAHRNSPNVEDFDARIKILQQSPTGALIFKRGHVLMLLGNDADGSPIAIHAASSYYLDDKKIYVSKVLVSAMSYPNDYGVSTVNALTGINFVKGL